MASRVFWWWIFFRNWQFVFVSRSFGERSMNRCLHLPFVALVILGGVLGAAPGNTHAQDAAATPTVASTPDAQATAAVTQAPTPPASASVISIPGPMRSFLRMAAISQKVDRKSV